MNLTGLRIELMSLGDRLRLKHEVSTAKGSRGCEEEKTLLVSASSQRCSRQGCSSAVQVTVVSDI